MPESWKKIILLILHWQEKSKGKKSGRPNKQKLECYLDQIYYVLKTGIQWNRLKGELHWSSYYKKFSLWSQKKVFEQGFNMMQKILSAQKYLSEKGKKDLYIDSSMIKNVRGHDGLGVNHYDRERKGNKVSLIVTSDGIPLSMNMTSANVHDVHQVDDLIDRIHVKVIGSRLIGDKGYNSEKLKKEVGRKGLKLIYPMKKGSRKENSEEDKELLSRRNVVENVFSWMQNNRHLKLRYEKYVKNYIEFNYMGLMDLIGKKVDL